MELHSTTVGTGDRGKKSSPREAIEQRGDHMDRGKVEEGNHCGNDQRGRRRMQADLLDRLVGQNDDHDVNEPGNGEEEKSVGLPNVVVAQHSEAEYGLQNEDGRHGKRVGEGAAIGSLEKNISENCVRSEER